MVPNISRLVIAETVIPPTGADIEAGWMDLSMIVLSGKERTEQQWIDLLEMSGLKLEMVHRGLGTNYAAIEAVLQ
jgi:hypothetical protein